MDLSFAFIAQLLLTAAGVSMLAGTAGSYLLWRRLSFLAEVMCHGAVFGISLSLAVRLPLTAGILATVTGVIAFLRKDSQIRTAIASYAMLALGIGLLQTLPAGSGADPESYLWGDILLTGFDDVLLIWGLVITAGAAAYRYRDQILLSVFSEDLAAVEGVAVKRLETVCLFALGVVIACTVKVTGVLLFPALLVIPAAAARITALSPAGMVAVACATAFVAVTLGIAAAFVFNIAAGVAIVLCALICYITFSLVGSLRKCGMRSGR